MDHQADNDSFYRSWGLSRQARACLECARALFLQSNDANTLKEKLCLQGAALHLQRQALHLLEESDLLLRMHLTEEKAKIAEQAAKLEEKEESAPQD